MNNLYILGAYVQAPLVRETRLVSDLTMPQVDWDQHWAKRIATNKRVQETSRSLLRWHLKTNEELPALVRRQAD